jgi:hypothetical protein
VNALVLLELIPWKRGHPGCFLSRRDACAPRENHARMSVQVLRTQSVRAFLRQCVRAALWHTLCFVLKSSRSTPQMHCLIVEDTAMLIAESPADSQGHPDRGVRVHDASMAQDSGVDACSAFIIGDGVSQGAGRQSSGGSSPASAPPRRRSKKSQHEAPVDEG